MTGETGKGSRGDKAVKDIMLEVFGWPEVVDLARTYPGADLLCIRRYYGYDNRLLDEHLWVEVKTYPWWHIPPESRRHIRECAQLHEPDLHLTICRQQASKTGRKEWFVRAVDGEEVDASLLLSDPRAKPASIAYPPYTRGVSQVRTRAKPPTSPPKDGEGV